MQVRVLYFAGLRDRAGADGDELELPSGAQVSDAVAEAQRLRPGLAPLDTSVRFAVNLEFADGVALLSPGDEVAFLPPVSGG